MRNTLGKVGLSVIAAACLAACNDDDDDNSGPVPLTVPKVASCASGDKPETALQGQVPAALRASGFQGFNCNLHAGRPSTQNEGGNWSSATFTDGAGRTCAYYATPCRTPTARTRACR